MQKKTDSLTQQRQPTDTYQVADRVKPSITMWWLHLIQNSKHFRTCSVNHSELN